MENYENLGVIGEGTYGVVMKARHKATGQIVAIKKFKESDEDEQVRKTSLREVRVLKQLRHDNIITLLEVFRRKGKLYLVFEYVERTILEVLEARPNGLDPADVRRYAYQLLRAVEYCHAHNVMHRDIKPENILISKDGTLKLCDFGFARSMSVGGKYTDYVATRWYRSPELLVGDVEYAKAVDVWAIGCIFAEISNGMPLFPGESDADQLAHIMRCFGRLTTRQVQTFRRNPLYVGVDLPNPRELEDLDRRFPHSQKPWLQFLKCCLKNDPDQRESCAALMNLPYFTDNGFRDEFEHELRFLFEKERRLLIGVGNMQIHRGDQQQQQGTAGVRPVPKTDSRGSEPQQQNHSSSMTTNNGVGAKAATPVSSGVQLPAAHPNGGIGRSTVPTPDPVSASEPLTNPARSDSPAMQPANQHPSTKLLPSSPSYTGSSGKPPQHHQHHAPPSGTAQSVPSIGSLWSQYLSTTSANATATGHTEPLPSLGPRVHNLQAQHPLFAPQSSSATTNVATTVSGRKPSSTGAGLYYRSSQEGPLPSSSSTTAVTPNHHHGTTSSIAGATGGTTRHGGAPSVSYGAYPSSTPTTSGTGGAYPSSHHGGPYPPPDSGNGRAQQSMFPTLAAHPVPPPGGGGGPSSSSSSGPPPVTGISAYKKRNSNTHKKNVLSTLNLAGTAYGGGGTSPSSSSGPPPHHATPNGGADPGATSGGTGGNPYPGGSGLGGTGGNGMLMYGQHPPGSQQGSRRTSKPWMS